MEWPVMGHMTVSSMSRYCTSYLCYYLAYPVKVNTNGF